MSDILLTDYTKYVLSLPGLTGYWPLTERAGANQAQDLGPNALHLSSNNAPEPASDGPGIRSLDRATHFTGADNEYFNIADSATVSVGDIDFTWCIWGYLDVLALRIAVAQTSGTIRNDQYAYSIFHNTARWNFLVGINDGTNFGLATANTFGATAINTWYFVVGWHDSVNNTVNIQMNGGAVDSVAYTFGSYDAAAALQIGRNGTSNGESWNGRMCGIAFLKRVLTSQERTKLYELGLS